MSHGEAVWLAWKQLLKAQALPRSLLEKELESVGIRLNKHKPNIYFKVCPHYPGAAWELPGPQQGYGQLMLLPLYQ